MIGLKRSLMLLKYMLGVKFSAPLGLSSTKPSDLHFWEWHLFEVKRTMNEMNWQLTLTQTLLTASTPLCSIKRRETCQSLSIESKQRKFESWQCGCNPWFEMPCLKGFFFDNFSFTHNYKGPEFPSWQISRDKIFDCFTLSSFSSMRC